MARKLTVSEIQQQKNDKLMEVVGKSAAFYRANPHRFVEDYFDGITLRLFQIILLYVMNIMNFFVLFTSRGLGKTWLVAIFCCVRCILYPGSKIVIASSTREQGNLVLAKIRDEICKKSSNVSYEIDWANGGIKTSANLGECYFKNGSWIKVVTMSDSARGRRANIVFIDEFVLTNKTVIDKVIKKFLISSREPNFLNKPEYKDYPRERNKEFYASSAWLKSHWSYDKLKSYVNQMTGPRYRKFFACCLPYQIAIAEQLLDREAVKDQMAEDDFNPLTWMMEMECLFYGDTEESFFRFDTLTKQRVIKRAYPKLEDVVAGKANVPKLQKGERRILSVDVALMASRKHNNDASTTLINSAIPNKNGGYASNYLFVDDYEGLTTDELGMTILRCFYLYNCTDLVLDTNGIGTPVFDYIAQDHYDTETGMFYGALTTLDPKDPMAERCKVRNARRCVWSIKATAEFNSSSAMYLRNNFDTGKINLLINENEAELLLTETSPEYRKMSSYDRVSIKMPYVQTTLLIDELISLKTETNGTNIKLREASGKRKDRYSAMQYNNWVVECIARKRRAQAAQDDIEAEPTMLFKKPVIRRL